MCRLGRLLGLLGPADPGVKPRQERQIVRSASDLDGFLPEYGPFRGRLIGVRSVVQIYPGPLTSPQVGNHFLC